MKLTAWTLALAVCTIVVAKNSLPRYNSEDESRSLGRAVDTDAPAVQHGAATQVSEDHIFHGNYKTNFSWDDDQLQDRLWRGKDKQQKRDVAKRTPAGATVLGTVVKLPSCAGCIRKALTGEQASLSTLTSDYFETVMLLTQGELLDRCVFYTSVDDPSDATARWFLGGADKHSSLSKVATDWANAKNLVTIWNLYSGANDVTDAQDNPQDFNYWEVYTPGSWLNNLKDDQGTQFLYFAEMSTASKQLFPCLAPCVLWLESTCPSVCLQRVADSSVPPMQWPGGVVAHCSSCHALPRICRNSGASGPKMNGRQSEIDSSMFPKQFVSFFHPSIVQHLSGTVGPEKQDIDPGIHIHVVMASCTSPSS